MNIQKSVDQLAVHVWHMASIANSQESWHEAWIKCHAYTDALLAFNVDAYFDCREDFDFLRDLAFNKFLLAQQGDLK